MLEFNWGTLSDGTDSDSCAAIAAKEAGFGMVLVELIPLDTLEIGEELGSGPKLYFEPLLVGPRGLAAMLFATLAN